jgi:hypothetical protein
MLLPVVNAIAPMRSACEPTCTRTLEKSARRAASILLRIPSGKGRPPPWAKPSRMGSIPNVLPSSWRCATGRPAKAGGGGPGRCAANCVAVFGWTGGTEMRRRLLRKRPWITKFDIGRSRLCEVTVVLSFQPP